MSRARTREQEWTYLFNRCYRMRKLIKAIEREAKRSPEEAFLLRRAAQALVKRVEGLEREKRLMQFSA